MDYFCLSVIIVSFNSSQWLTACIAGVLEAGITPERVLVVDNASDDGSAQLVRERYPGVRIIENGVNLGFAGGANLGLRAVGTDLAVILNPDVIVRPSTLPALADALASDSRVAVAGCKLLYPDGRTIQHAGGTLSHPLALAEHLGYGEVDRGQFDEVREVEYVTGAAFAIRRSVLDEVGYFDEGFYPAYVEEADLCHRVRQAGYKVLYVPRAVAIHYEAVTAGKHSLQQLHFYHRGRLRFVLKHFSDEQLWGGFFPAELQRLSQVGSSRELEAVQKAYADNLAVLEGRADFIVNTAAAARLPDSPRRLEMLRALSTWSESLLSIRSALEGRTGGAFHDLHATLCAKANVVEQPFTSTMPLLGPAVVRVRELWNWMSTKWYVRPLVHQQNEFNVGVVSSLQILDQSIRTLKTWMLERTTDGIQRHREQLLLDARLERIEKQLADLQRDIARSKQRKSQAE